MEDGFPGSLTAWALSGPDEGASDPPSLPVNTVRPFQAYP